jgi:predicted PurR-regulated permease PerM
VALAEAKEVLGVKKLLLNAHGYVLSVPSEIIIYVLAKVGAGETATLNAQGALAGLGFWMTGVPRPLFVGIAATIASLVPAVGTLLVWVPAGLYLLAVGSPSAAVVELAWGALMVVGFTDYVIRPRLVGDEGMPEILTFLALFGGLEVLGLPGLIAGPVLMALAVAVLRLYARDTRGARAP